MQTLLDHLIPLLAAIATAYYLSVAWNQSYLPVMVFRILGRAVGKLWKPAYQLAVPETRTDLEVAIAMTLPAWFSIWTQCFICQAPYLSAATSFGALLVSKSLAQFPWVWLVTTATVTYLQKKSGEILPPLMHVPVTELPQQQSHSAEQALGPLARTLINPNIKQTIKQWQAKVEGNVAQVQSEKQATLQATSKQLMEFNEIVGIETEPGEGGSLKVKSISQEALQVQKFFDNDAACWFEGCAELRQQYIIEFDKAGGADCPPCVQGELRRKYILLALAAWKGNTRAKTLADSWTT